MVNLVVQYPPLDRTFAALSDPTRRAVLERLGRGPATISELAAPTGMSLTGLKKHVRILEDAGLVTTEKHGRTRHCYLGPRGLEDVSDWVEAYRRTWDDRFDRLEQVIERKRGTSNDQ
jgi:DNA-binding transcriptional ArsR family regulator